MTPPALRVEGVEDGVERGAPFPGFVARGAAITLPAQFFSELLPLIDDEAELRVTLYALYAIGRRKGTLRAVRVSQLASEEPLRRALASCGGDAALTPALERAVARGSLLTLALEDGDTLCFMNSAAGRRNRERLRSGALRPPPGVRVAAPREQPGGSDTDAPAKVYEQEIGALTAGDHGRPRRGRGALARGVDSPGRCGWRRATTCGTGPTSSRSCAAGSRRESERKGGRPMRSLAQIMRERNVATTDRTSASSVAADPAAPAGERDPACPLCGGARFVRVTADPASPDFGRALPCSCAAREDDGSRRERLLRYSRLGALARFSFDTLLPHGRSSDPAAQQRYAAAVEAARRFADDPEGWLVFSGVPGCGKTHLAAAIANRAIERGRPALFLSVADFLDRLRASYGDDAEVSYELLSDQFRDAPLAVLDDLDSYSETPWAREKFAQLVSHRFHAALPTVFTCVRPPEQIDERLGARLSDPAIAQHFTLEETSSPRYFEVGGMSRERLAELTFERFRPGGHGLRGEQRRNLEGAFRLARGWAERPAGWLVLLGANGSGKTHLAAAIAGHRLEQGDRVAFATAPDLLDELRSTFAPDSGERFDPLFRRLRDAGLLVLDDLGVEKSGGWAQEKLYQLLNYRHLGRRPTVITSDLALTELEPRIASRLSDLQVATAYELRAPDYRTGA